MSRVKRQRLKRRKDGRYCCKYHGIQFMGLTEDEALQAREEYKRQEAEGEYIRDNPTVMQYAEQWIKLQSSGIAAQTLKEKKVLLKKLTDSIGDSYLRSVIPSDIKDVYTNKFKGVSNSYVKAGAQLYRTLFDAAVEDGYLKTNPARQKSSKPHKGSIGGHRAITSQEREWIETLCTDHRAHAAVMAMLYAGIRPQEAKAVDIDRDVDLKKETLTLTRFVHYKTSNKYEITTKGKTDKAARQIPIFPPLKKALDGLHGMLIQSASGKQVTVQSWRSVWESYKNCLETQINGCPERWYGRKREHKGKKLQPFIHVSFTPYDLRHSFCTMCRDNGVEINTCIHWMGHKDAKMILKIYDEYSSERGRKEAEKLKKSLFGMQDGMQEESATNKAPDAAAKKED